MGLGYQTLNELVEDGYLTSIADIYRLPSRLSDELNGNISSPQTLHTKKGWGEKSVRNLIENIEKRRSISLSKYSRPL